MCRKTPSQVGITNTKHVIHENFRDVHACSMFGAKMHILTMRQTLDYILYAINNSIKITHSVVNVAKIVNMQRDRLLRQAVNSSDLVNVDGMGLVWGLKLLGFKIPERVTGIDLMDNLLFEANSRGLRVFVLGAKQDVLEQAIANIKSRFSNIVLGGFQHGYYRETDIASIIAKINDSNAQLLFVAMPTPKKENFINSYKNILQATFIMGVGGSIDIYAGIVQRSPLWMQKLGLEWFYRFLQEPKRMWKRYLITNTSFAIMLIKAKIRILVNKL